MFLDISSSIGGRLPITTRLALRPRWVKEDKSSRLSKGGVKRGGIGILMDRISPVSPVTGTLQGSDRQKSSALLPQAINTYMLTLTGPMQLRLPWNGAISSPVSMSGHREKQNWPPGLPRCVTAPYLQLLIREWKLDMFPGVFDRVQKSVLLYCCCL